MSRLAEMPHCWTLAYSYRLEAAGWEHREHGQKVQAMAPPFLLGNSCQDMADRLREQRKSMPNPARAPRIMLADIPAGPEDCA